MPELAHRQGAPRIGHVQGVFFSSGRGHTRYWRDWSSDVCSSDLWSVGAGGRHGRGRGMAATEAMTEGGVAPDGDARVAKAMGEALQILDRAWRRAQRAEDVTLVQIGRAAGRERGYTSGVAGYLTT